VVSGGTNNDGPEKSSSRKKVQMAAKAVRLLSAVNGWFLREAGIEYWHQGSVAHFELTVIDAEGRRVAS
jgi:hypothetical protein